jgi:hypothetical protein
MSELPYKKFRSTFGDNVIELDYYHSQNKKFYLDQHISKFILKNMGSYPEAELMQVLSVIIDRACKNTKKRREKPKTLWNDDLW